MKEKLWGSLDLIVESSKPIYQEVLMTNHQIFINNTNLQEHDIFINQLDDTIYNVSVVVSYDPSTQNEEEAFSEGNSVFNNLDISTFNLEDCNFNVVEVPVVQAKVQWEEFI